MYDTTHVGCQAKVRSYNDTTHVGRQAELRSYSVLCYLNIGSTVMFSIHYIFVDILFFFFSWCRDGCVVLFYCTVKEHLG